MRIWSFVGFGLLSAAFAVAETVLTGEPEVVVTVSFPEENPFGHIVNGERNKVLLLIENKSESNITLMSAGGSVHDPESGALIKNISTLSYGIPLFEGAKIQIPFNFYSEFRPGDRQLNLWLEHVADGQLYRVPAYDSVVTVVEPEMSIFDPQMLITYVLSLSLLGGLGFLAYRTFAPTPKRPTRKSKPTTSAISEPVEVTATGTGGYQEEWIPEHHLRKAKGVKRTKSGGGILTSGDELSGAETSGAESKKATRRK